MMWRRWRDRRNLRRTLRGFESVRAWRREMDALGRVAR